MVGILTDFKMVLTKLVIGCLIPLNSRVIIIMFILIKTRMQKLALNKEEIISTAADECCANGLDV